MPTRQEVINYITQAAQRRGIDPEVALRVFHGESGFNPNAKLITPREASYGVTQLNIKNGLGVDALRRGIDPRDPNQWQSTIDFSLDHVKRGGWTPWSAATKAGVSRWGGVQRDFNPENIRPPKSIDIGDQPTLASLNPPTKTPSKPRSDMSGGAQTVLSQLAPTEASNMARPSIPDAIREAMDETIRGGKVRTAGFVPPGLTAGSAKTRAKANEAVQPRGTMKDVEGEAKRAKELREVPDAGAQIGAGGRNPSPDETRALATWSEANDAYMAGRGPDPGPPPPVEGLTVPPGGGPRVKSATDPKGAADFREGGPAARTDPTLAAQNDPAAQSSLADRIAGRARTMGAPLAVGAGVGAAVVGGSSQKAKDPALAAVEQQMQASPGANIDPGTAKMLAAQEQSAGLPQGTLSGGNAGWKTSALPVGGMLKEAMPVFKEVMKDPQARQAMQVLAPKVVQAKARTDAMTADMQKDPTYYQRMQSMRQPQQMPNDPNNPLAERQMMDAVARDQRGSMTRGMPPSQQQQDPAVAMVQQQMQVRPPQPVPTQAVTSARPPVVAQTEQSPQQGVPWASNNPYPPGVTPTPGAYDPTTGVQGMPNAGQMPMDPAMMQLMQFFGGGGE
jgi:hypothetical protein